MPGLKAGRFQLSFALINFAAARRDITLPASGSVRMDPVLPLDIFNIFDAKDSDIDYYYASRLPGEPPGGKPDVHFHATLPRTVRVNLIVGF